jgi:hypothetical protein
MLQVLMQPAINACPTGRRSSPGFRVALRAAGAVTDGVATHRHLARKGFAAPAVARKSHHPAKQRHMIVEDCEVVAVMVAGAIYEQPDELTLLSRLERKSE